MDVLAVFTNKDRIFEQYRSDSKRFLYRIRDALSSYQVKVVGARGQAVRLFYQNPPHVDIAPVFKWDGGGYALPAGNGSWLTTDPFVQADWISARNETLSGHLKPVGGYSSVGTEHTAHASSRSISRSWPRGCSRK